MIDIRLGQEQGAYPQVRPNSLNPGWHDPPGIPAPTFRADPVPAYQQSLPAPGD